MRLLDLAARLPLLSRVSHHFEELYEASYQLLAPRPLAAGLTLRHYPAFARCPTLPTLGRRLDAEFPDYWLNKASRIVSADPADDPVPFGRTKADADRLEAVERDRHTDPAALLARVRDSLVTVSDTLRSWPDEAWTRTGQHVVRGPMTIDAIVERFIVEHLEEHADQLDAIPDA